MPWLSVKNLKPVRDFFLNAFFSRNCRLVYIVENSDWVILQEGKNFMENLKKLNLLEGRISTCHWGLRNKIIHFGSVNTLIDSRGIKKIHPSNKTVLTWFHVAPNDQRIKYVPELNTAVDLVHTACEITRKKLIAGGLKPEKIIVVPMGIDLKLFHSVPPEMKKQIKKELDLPENKTIIGSFQKDGSGWGEGLEPKMIKGPDIFCEAVEKIAQKHPVHILLTGPARGYVKKRLSAAKIPFTHVYLKNYPDISRYYQALDLYIISSREEGGPKATLESLASGVPLVSTRVGLAPEMIEDGENGFLAENFDPDAVARKVLTLMENPDLQEKFRKNGLEKIRNYRLSEITRELYEKIYRKLL